MCSPNSDIVDLLDTYYCKLCNNTCRCFEHLYTLTHEVNVILQVMSCGLSVYFPECFKGVKTYITLPHDKINKQINYSIRCRLHQHEQLGPPYTLFFRAECLISLDQPIYKALGTYDVRIYC